MIDLQALLERTAARHSHLCPRQVLGVRVGLAGLAALGIELPYQAKRLLVIVETDGCFVDGLEVATGVSIGHRTLRVVDYGKTAAIFIDTWEDQAVRVTPRQNVRQQAWDYAPGEEQAYNAMLQGYQTMPAEVLFNIQSVSLLTPLEKIISQPGLRTSCDRCGEEIINEREVKCGELTLCRFCAGDPYYQPQSE